MTPTMKDNLLRAIALAQKPGSCLYIHEGKPCCVIAQLLLLEGGDLEDIKASWIDNGEHIPIHRVENRGRLAKYPIKVLKQLQAIWDYPDYACSYMDKLVQMEKFVDSIPISGG